MRRFSAMETVLAAVLVLAASIVAPALAQPWSPPEPEASERDWIQLVSGEWLWGDIERFQDLTLDFDSEELDNLSLDWKDISVLRSARILTYTFEGNGFRDKTVVSGTAVMQDGIIRVQAPDGIQEFPRRRLLTIIEGEARELNFWSAKASLGLTARAGNTEQSDLNALAKLRREAPRSRVNVGYTGNLSRVDSAETINNHRGDLSWNIIVRRGFFVSPLLAELYTDRFQNIDIRGTLGAGVGVFIVRNGAVEWNVQLGGSYRATYYRSVEVGEDDVDKTGSVVPATVLEADITSDIELDFSYSAQIGVPDPKDSTHHLQTLLTVDLLGDVFELSFSLTWDRIENPRASSDGILPKRDDLRIAAGVAVDL